MRRWTEFAGLLVVLILAVCMLGCTSTSVDKPVEKINTLSKELNKTKENLTATLDELSKAKEEINKLNSELTSIRNETNRYNVFLKYYFKGLASLLTASDLGDTADNNYNLAGDYYDRSEYDNTMKYSKIAQEQYTQVTYKLKSAKEYFKKAAEYAPNEKYREVMNLYIQICDSNVKLGDYMHEAAEYLYSAANCYSSGQWSAGDMQIEEHNKRINAHDLELDHYRELLAKLEIALNNL